jgi:hypothetical protein
MNINAIWSLYSSIVPPRLKSEHDKPALDHLPAGGTDKRDQEKSAEIDCDFRNTNILRVTELIARGS